jgi:hypothetical protein
MAKDDLREKFFEELLSSLNKAGIKAIIKISTPTNGRTIKLNGVALYKVLNVPNPFKNRGVAIYRKLTDKAIAQLGGKRVNGKNDWVGAPLTELNYKDMKDILFSVAYGANQSRTNKIIAKKKEMKEENKDGEI